VGAELAQARRWDVDIDAWSALRHTRVLIAFAVVAVLILGAIILMTAREVIRRRRVSSGDAHRHPEPSTAEERRNP
jgi:hypothetical protein